MIQKQRKYLDFITTKIQEHFADKPNTQAFLFGSSIVRDHFGDVDIGIQGDIEKKDIMRLKEEFENSTFPFFVDIIDFDQVDDSFRNNVLQNPVVWIKRS
ncbi:MAG: nucleotidyltransferase domain-containing protein [Candidatus Kerfeldbacteria bacterium]|nr:nucleotidyltransferase domain-containing protein [Candidatus Kerfeldbacteria bacterium]